ncbi:Lacal_2735 family protein [Labilibacter marinus]|uniref:Lacal_2735 family protein n=1 Tax=Labilibacter marinus TaxID=1477105 RepID=UPI00117BBF11|nr:Lacal_2735 family protein [Labilibacter marinus]
MFKFFKKKTKVEQLHNQYQKLTKEAFRLSRINRRASDEMAAEANMVMKKIQVLQEG